MRGPGVRYTVSTEEDVENLETKWALQYGSLILEGVTGHYETSVVDELPADLQDVFKNASRARITFRSSDEVGDLFYTDVLPGTTIELYRADASATMIDTETVKFVEILTGKSLESASADSAFIEVRDARVFYDVIPPTPAFLDYLVDRYPDIRTHMYGASMVELEIDMKSSMLQLRILAKIPQTLKLPASTVFAKTEVGIVQRQKRHLQDSEFKGLSAFLPASDLSPFMIFFDQRQRPLISSREQQQQQQQQQVNFVATIEGTGSHLSFNTRLGPRKHIQQLLAETPNCRLWQEYRLPKEYFFDAFELQHLLPNKTRLYGEQDLEAPTWSLSKWGSILYIDVQDAFVNHVNTHQDAESGGDEKSGESRTNSATRSMNLRIPFHARYSRPIRGARAQRTKIMAPQVFVASHVPDQAFSDNPWESSTVKQSIIGQDYAFRFIPNGGPLSYELSAAVADSSHEQLVARTTVGMIWLGFFYILLVMLRHHKQRGIIAEHKKAN